ncbi:MAG TPA: ImmA/IrrE family metallo-endopeptidase [Thermomicrobiales bacterium]|nr:ImmA/IrrE family metallo-endopeptidase [Thermomicrobiales bacterium]
MTRPELVAAARQFWADPRIPAGTPRSVEWAISCVHPVSIEFQPRLSIGTLQDWMDAHGFGVRLDDRNRRLRGCAMAHGGSGLIVLDTDDDPAEQDFTLAHEVAHLLLDYYGPRDRLAGMIDDHDGAVFDGHQAPSIEQQISAALRGHDLRPFVHLLARDANRTASPAVLAREQLADELACELLAPMDEVRTRLQSGQDVRDVNALLRDRYRLPAGASDDYARRLVRRFLPPPTFVDWLSG